MTAKQVYEGEPSSSRSFLVWTPTPGSLYLSGNPAKLLQGHNLWGSMDARGSFLEAGVWVRQRVGLFPGPPTWESCQFSGPRYTRLDITRSYRFGSEQEASAFMRYIVATARSRHGAATLYGAQTAYFGQRSRRWTMKIYCKRPEMEQARTKLENALSKLGRPDDLIDWATGVVRFELTLRGLEIRTNYPDADLNDSATLERIWTEKFSTIQFNENAAMAHEPDLLEQELSPTLRGVLAMWRLGEDVRGLYSKPTYYRHRKALLNTTGIDINSAPPPPTVGPRADFSALSLDEDHWDPEPIQPGVIEPRASVKADYRQRDLSLDEPA